MGTFNIKSKVWKVGDTSKTKRVELTVDTGSTYTVIPKSVLEGLGVEKKRNVRLKIADGEVISRPSGEVGIQIEDLAASATPVVFGEEGVYLLGAVTMEQLSLAPDPVQKRLVTTVALMMRVSLAWRKRTPDRQANQSVI